MRVGTRGSALALKQTEIASDALRAIAGRELEIEIVRIRTSGDTNPDKPYEAIGPKGIFARELERALASGEIDVAVHSLKDLPSEIDASFVLAAVLERGEARDVLVSRNGRTLAELDRGAVVGTSSARRRALVAVDRPDLEIAMLRGNVDTRLEKVRRGDVDAAVLAGAGLVRLGRESEVTEWLDPERFVPSPGQGAIVVETLAERATHELAWVASADHAATRSCVEAERAFMREIEGGCDVPLGAWARLDGSTIVLEGFVAGAGGEHARGTERGHDPIAVGEDLARRVKPAT